MIDNTLQPSVVEQARQDLSVAASMRERANRPKIYLIGAFLLLAAAVIYVLVGLASRSSAQTRVASARRNADEIIGMVNRVKSLQETLASRGLNANPAMGSQLENLAKGFDVDPGTISDSGGTSSPAPGITERRYTVTLVNQDPAAILNFLNATQTDPTTAGVEIQSVSLRPGDPDPTSGLVRWGATIQLRRYERTAK